MPITNEAKSPTSRVDAGDEGKGDDLGDQREGADHPGQDVASGSGASAEPFGAIAGK